MSSSGSGSERKRQLPGSDHGEANGVPKRQRQEEEIRESLLKNRRDHKKLQARIRKIKLEQGLKKLNERMGGVS